jgi:hypothetical protein
MSEINEDDEEQIPSVASPAPILNLKPAVPGSPAPQNFKSILKTSSFNKQQSTSKNPNF